MTGPPETSGAPDPEAPTVPPPRRPPSIWDPWKGFWIGHPLLLPPLCGLAYGLGVRIAFGAMGGKAAFWTMTVGLLGGLPFAMGAFIAWVLPAPRFGAAILHAILAYLLLLAASLVSALEGAICIVMAAPAGVVCAVCGALAATSLRRFLGHGDEEPGGPGGAAAVLLLPYIVAGAETRERPRDEVRVVETSIDVRAPRDVVWANVVRVPAIREEERETTFSHRIGFPRPLEATISGTGVGAVRHATFERDVLFVETVTVWREGEELAFSIDPARVPPKAFDEHVSPGGPIYSTLEGRYRLEPLGDGRVRLHLTSRSRLTTSARVLVGPWVDAAMESIQDDILRIVRDRCERGEVPR